MSLPIIFDGLDLNDGETYVVSNFAQSVGTRETDLITIPGRDGAVVGQNTMQPTVFTFDIAILGATVEERDKNLSNLFGITIGGVFHEVLSSESECELVITESDTSARHYQAIPAGGEVTRFADGLAISGVTFTCPDPTYTDGVTHTVTGIPSVIDYEGNAPGDMRISYTAAAGSGIPNGNGISWACGDTSGVFAVYFYDAVNPRTVNVDTAARTARVIGSGAEDYYDIPTLASDWPQLMPGSNTFDTDASLGTITGITVEYQTRWVG